MMIITLQQIQQTDVMMQTPHVMKGFLLISFLLNNFS